MRSTSLAILMFLTLCLCVPTTTHALKPERSYKARPSDYGIVFQEVTFLTSDGIAIKGWFYPAQDTMGIGHSLVGRYVPVPSELKHSPRPYSVLDSSQRPTIIVCLGDAGNMTYLILYAYHLCTQGFNVLTFDWRGFGESGDWKIDQDLLCYTEFLTDYDAALDYIKMRPEVDSTRIGVFGFSTGAYLSFAIAARRHDVAAYAGRGLMTSFTDVLSTLRKVEPTRPLRAPEDYPPELQPLNAAKAISIPTFLVVGALDDRTPPWMTEMVADDLTSPKELWIVPDAEHGGIAGPEFRNYPEFFSRLVVFFKKHLKQT